MKLLDGGKSVQQELAALTTDLHERLRPCDGEVCLKILILLAGGERTVGSLATMLDLDMPAVSARLGVLKQEELVVYRTDGRRRYYELSPQVRVGDLDGDTFLELKCAPGGMRLMILIPGRIIQRLKSTWNEIEGQTSQRRTRPTPEVRQITVREIAARARIGRKLGNGRKRVAA